MFGSPQGHENFHGRDDIRWTLCFFKVHVIHVTKNQYNFISVSDGLPLGTPVPFKVILSMTYYVNSFI